MRRFDTFLISTLALSALMGSCSQDHPAGETVSLEPVRARVAVAERTEIPETIVLRGTVEAARVAVVSTRVMASVIAVHVSAGDRVQRGDLLIEMDPQASRGQLAQAEGGLARARAARALAERNYRRYEALAERDAVSELEVDQARMQLDQATAAVEQASGGVASASSMAADARVTAPFDGRIVRRMVEPGDLAAPGRPLVGIESEGARRVATRVPESIQARVSLEVGGPVAVSLDTRPDLGRIQGSVVEISPGADPMVHAFEVKISIPVPDVPTGAGGRVWIETGRRPAVLVPETAVIEQGGLEMVVVRNQEGETTTRVIKTGAKVEPERIEVLAGLSGGESVLLGLGSIPPAGSPVGEGSP